MCFLFDEKKTEDEKYHTRTTLPPERFSPYFLYFKIWWRDGVSTCSWKLPICYKSTEFIHNTSGCNCIKTNTFKALNKNHNRGHILDVLRVLGGSESPIQMFPLHHSHPPSMKK